jgi:hypothetical protein
VVLLLSLPVTAAPLAYDKDIRPILTENCFKCHGLDEHARKAKLRLDVRDTALAKKAFIPGDPAKSELVKRITTTDPDDHMPPPDSGKKLTPAQIETLKTWIAQGAPYAGHWAFQPIKSPAVPTIGNPIDAFIRAKLQSENLKPSAEADKRTLIRRVTFDLTGLPPTPEEVQAFLDDPSENAYEKVVDRLLASPHYGERMALEWLDAARYGDTHGYHIDSARDMTAWREWVIDAFNTNKPFDQFTVEQIAGDLLPNSTLQQKIASGFNRNHMINFEGGAVPEEYHTAYLVDRVSTTGTVWLGLTVACAQCHDHKYDPITQKEFYQLYAFFNNLPEKGLDGIDGNAAPFLKTPTPEQQKKLDSLAARIAEREKVLHAPNPQIDAEQQRWEQSLPDQKSKLEALPPKMRSLALAAFKSLPQDPSARQKFYREHLSPTLKKTREDLATAKREREETDQKARTTMVMQEMEKPRETHLLIRGQYDKKGDRVYPTTPTFLPALVGLASASGPRTKTATTQPTRLDLAHWLVSRENPLTARVTVNRYWQLYFGTGIVKTAEDFGTQGEYPSHPELLDYLAARFIDSGWDVKTTQRLIVTSQTYRQSSVVTPDLVAKDPENRLLARGPRFRLPAEFIRDQALAVSDLLNRQIGGPSVSPYQPAGLWEELMSREDGDRFTAQKYLQSHGQDLYRRTMYTFWKRTSPPPTLTTFDAPDRETCTVRRPRTNTPLQALVLLNDPTYLEASRRLAERLLTEPASGSTTDARITRAFQLLTARAPTAEELQILQRAYNTNFARFQKDPKAAESLLKQGESPLNEKLDKPELAAWTMLSSILLNLDEVVTKN